jgi:integrase/recombinase XerD
VRLHEKGGKEHDVPCHHRLDQCLHEYIESAGLTDDVDGYLFRGARRKTGQLTSNPLFQQDAHRIIRRRAKAAGIETRIGNHTFRATVITAYLKNSGKLEVAQQIANHESPRTTKLYDRRQDEISLDEIERNHNLKKAGCQDSGSIRNIDPGPSWNVGFTFFPLIFAILRLFASATVPRF